MSRRKGRAYLFIRWSGGNLSTRLGDVVWAFENIDSQGKLYRFHYGATEIARVRQEAAGLRSFWTEKCMSLPDLIKAMSTRSADRPGFDEAKAFEVMDASAANFQRAISLVQHFAGDSFIRDEGEDRIGGPGFVGEPRNRVVKERGKSRAGAERGRMLCDPCCVGFSCGDQYCSRRTSICNGRTADCRSRHGDNAGAEPESAAPLYPGRAGRETYLNRQAEGCSKVHHVAH